MQNTPSSAAAGAVAVVLPATAGAPTTPPAAVPEAPPAREIDGPAGPEPTRYGDWERNGRCIDF
jgi:hypothetical protein